ncbi:hypothetical protein SKAU_G00227900 [Synaphobranchus kaupii]|uniref:Uncharacterized protein n=1 Tax=Synaphobranchus kaupii TaxID=118154 RepID=A0A9Q1F5G4_SYNKA|nr:hypothetical protein SKAU_G00227900 [Synaphobranchus kaupii]
MLPVHLCSVVISDHTCQTVPPIPIKLPPVTDSQVTISDLSIRPFDLSPSKILIELGASNPSSLTSRPPLPVIHRLQATSKQYYHFQSDIPHVTNRHPPPSQTPAVPPADSRNRPLRELIFRTILPSARPMAPIG